MEARDDDGDGDDDGGDDGNDDNDGDNVDDYNFHAVWQGFCCVAAPDAGFTLACPSTGPVRLFEHSQEDSQAGAQP